MFLIKKLILITAIGSIHTATCSSLSELLENNSTTENPFIALLKDFDANLDACKETDRPPISEKMRFSCSDCNAKYQTATRLAEHEKIHRLGAITAQCSVCLFHFSTLKKLHLKHEDQHDDAIEWTFWQNKQNVPAEKALALQAPKTYPCPDCPGEYHTQRCLARHTNAHRPDTIAVQCSVCKIHFSTYKNKHLKHKAKHPDDSIEWTVWRGREKILE